MRRIIDNESLNVIGKRIKEARKKAKMTQLQLSAKLELKAIYICRGSISRIENCERSVNDIEIRAISEVLGVSLDYLFGNEKEEVARNNC